MIEKSFLELEPQHYQGCSPTYAFINELAYALVYGARHVMIPDTKSHFRTIGASNQFQVNTLVALQHIFSATGSDLLRPAFMVDDHPDKDAIYAQSKLQIEELELDGLDNEVKRLHNDSFRRMFPSLLYGQKANIQGGHPLIFDGKAFAEAKETDIDFARDIKHQLDFAHAPELGYHDHELFAWHHPRKGASEYTLKYDDINCSRNPLLFFNNRRESGIMHGATKVRRKDRNKQAYRPVKYAAISYEIPKKFLDL